MTVNSNLYLHDSDKAAMAALKAIPGFSQVMKAYMKVWDEQQFKIINMSTNLRLSEGQMTKYYAMLPPICEKLGIDIPELYITLDVNPNAYTYGDTKPFIVVTSGLFETLPDELIPTVLAHECGHIACHHTLYTTMGNTILSGAASFVNGLGNIALYPIQLAFAYWMRCSEFSADRAAAICDGNAEKVIEMCMRFAGYDKDIASDANVDLFMEQAEEYRNLINNSNWNKTLEFLLFQNYEHPINAVRAYESREWEKSERFSNICDYLNSSSDEKLQKLPVELTPKKYIGKNVLDIQASLLGQGFTNITLARCTESASRTKPGEIIGFIIDGCTEPNKDFFKRNSEIVLKFYEPKTTEEIILEHTGEILLETPVKRYVGKKYTDVIDELRMLGFNNIQLKEMAIPKLPRKGTPGNVAKIVIEQSSQFEKKSWFKPDSEIILYYYQ